MTVLSKKKLTYLLTEKLPARVEDVEETKCRRKMIIDVETVSFRAPQL